MDRDNEIARFYADGALASKAGGRGFEPRRPLFLSRLIGIATVPAAAALITTVTVLNRLGAIPLDELAATPRAIDEGRIWLLLTSAAVADRPAVPSIVGFVVVGLAALAVAGSRTVWISALLGHVLATVVVYAALDLASYSTAQPDYGTSAVIAAWIGVIAYHWQKRGRGGVALGLCVVAGLVGWFFRPDLDVLDTEHVVALAFGAATAAMLPKMRIRRLPPIRLLLRYLSLRGATDRV